MSVANVEPLHLRPADLRHEIEHEFAHAAWGPGCGLAEVSTAAYPAYTLLGRKAVQGKGVAWAWEYRGRYQHETGSHWLTEDDSKSSFTPLQPDAIHAMWEVDQEADCHPRPDSVPLKGEQDCVEEGSVNATPGRYSGEEGVQGRLGQAEGVYGGGIRLQRDILANTLPGRGLGGARGRQMFADTPPLSPN